MRKAIAFAGLSLLAGCAYPNPQHVQALNAMIGKPEAEVVRAYGVPVRTIETGGSKFLAYSNHHIDSYPDGPYFGGYGWRRYGWGGGWGGYGGDIVEFQCDTTFELTAGLVKTYTLRGNAC
jgi:hypothetical protein